MKSSKRGSWLFTESCCAHPASFSSTRDKLQKPWSSPSWTTPPSKRSPTQRSTLTPPVLTGPCLERTLILVVLLYRETQFLEFWVFWGKVNKTLFQCPILILPEESWLAMPEAKPYRMGPLHLDRKSLAFTDLLTGYSGSDGFTNHFWNGLIESRVELFFYAHLRASFVPTAQP